MSKNRKNTSIYVTAFIFFAAALGYLCFTGFSENSVYFLNVSEARAATPDKLKQARLFGQVSTGSIEKNLDTVSFRLADIDNAEQFIPVVFKGIVPDNFKPGAEVIVEGGMTGDGNFRASSLMTKCPSKYQKENRKS